MAQLNRVRVALTGYPGGPGVSTFYFRGLQTARQSLQSFYTAILGGMPDDVRVQVEATGDIIESTTGDLVGSWVKDPLPALAGTDPGLYAAPVGVLVRWNTGSIVGGKRVRGRTFLVPITNPNFNTFGQVSAAAVAQIEGAANAFRFEQSLDFVIWSRPFAGSVAVPPRPARPPRLGSDSLVLSASVSPKAAVLRSRRD